MNLFGKKKKSKTSLAIKTGNNFKPNVKKEIGSHLDKRLAVFAQYINILNARSTLNPQERERDRGEKERERESERE